MSTRNIVSGAIVVGAVIAGASVIYLYVTDDDNKKNEKKAEKEEKNVKKEGDLMKSFSQAEKDQLEQQYRNALEYYSLKNKQNRVKQNENKVIKADDESKRSKPLSNSTRNQSNKGEFFPNCLGTTTLLKRILTREIYVELADQTTKFGSTLDECLRPGLDNPEGNPDDKAKKFMSCGFVAYDAECYDLFRLLFDKIIEIRHPKINDMMIYDKRICDLSSFKFIKCPKFDSSDVLRIDVEIHRNLRNYPFPPKIDRVDRRRVTKVLIEALKKATKNESIEVEFEKITDDQCKSLTKLKQYPMAPSSSYRITSGLRRDWPDGRSVWLCENEGIVAHLNTDDHLVLIAYTTDGILETAAKKCYKFHEKVTNILSSENEHFAFTERLGYLTTFPELLGSGMLCRAEVQFSMLLDQSDIVMNESNAGFVIKTFKLDKEEKTTTIVIETKLCLGYNDFQILQMFEGGLERLLKLVDEFYSKCDD